MKKLLIFSLLIVIISGAVILVNKNLMSPQVPLTANLVSEVNPPTEFLRADGTYTLSFPEDYGAHPDYQTEWWYYTGNLSDEDGRHFGYQLTFFRRALIPMIDRVARQSSFASDQIYMAHYAVSDVSTGKHHFFERFSRGAPELAGAASEPFAVWLEDWQVIQTSTDEYKLTAWQDGIEIEILLKDAKGTILHGEQGYSQKGPGQGNASYYFSQTRLFASGVVRIKGKEYEVSGTSWMDHEFSTSALSTGQVGWDWFSIQLDNYVELMVFQIRRADGSIDPFSSGTLVFPDSSTINLPYDSFNISVLDTWTSSRSGARYPTRWQINVPGYNLAIEINPYLVNQEMDVSFKYWEGAVQIKGQMQDEDVRGTGYVEMTGYSESMEGEF